MTISVLSPAPAAVTLEGGTKVFARTSLGGIQDTVLDPSTWAAQTAGSGAVSGVALSTGRTPASYAGLRSSILYGDFDARVVVSFARRPDPALGRVTVPAALRCFDALGLEFGLAVEDRTFLTAFPPAAEAEEASAALRLLRRGRRCWAYRRRPSDGAWRLVGRTVAGPSGLVGLEVAVSNGNDDALLESSVSEVTLTSGVLVARRPAEVVTVVDASTLRFIAPALAVADAGPADLELFGPWGSDTLAGALEANFETPLVVKSAGNSSLTRR